MAWIHRGRKYWYHNGKRYSRRLKRKINNGYFVAPKKLYTIKDIKIKTHDGYKIVKTPIFEDKNGNFSQEAFNQYLRDCEKD